MIVRESSEIMVEYQVSVDRIAQLRHTPATDVTGDEIRRLIGRHTGRASALLWAAGMSHGDASHKLEADVEEATNVESSRS